MTSAAQGYPRGHGGQGVIGCRGGLLPPHENARGHRTSISRAASLFFIVRITARVSEAAQPVRKHASECHNRRQPYNGSATTASDDHDLSERKGRLLQTLVIPGPNECSSLAARRQRCRLPVTASNDATVRWQRHASIRQAARRFGAPSRVEARDHASVGTKQDLPGTINPSALQRCPPPISVVREMFG